MKSIIKKIAMLVIPLILLNLFLYDNNIYRSIISQNDHIYNWFFPRENLKDWADVIIIGNSRAAWGVDPVILQDGLKTKQTVWNIAQSGSTPSMDYFSLARILATCRKCPRMVVYAITELGFKEGELTSHQEVYDNLEIYYMDTDEENETLKEAAEYDPFYKDVWLTFNLNRIYRPYVIRRQLISLIKRNNIYSGLFNAGQINKQQVLEKSNVGHVEMDWTLTSRDAESSINIHRSTLKDYKVGKASKLFLKRFVDVAKKNNVGLVFIEMPLAPIYVDRFKGVLATYKQNIDPYLKQWQSKSIDDTHYFTDLKMFSDIHHLNVRGAKKYTIHLADEMNKL